jgi:hypothetical protein
MEKLDLPILKIAKKIQLVFLNSIFFNKMVFIQVTKIIAIPKQSLHFNQRNVLFIKSRTTTHYCCFSFHFPLEPYFSNLG